MSWKQPKELHDKINEDIDVMLEIMRKDPHYTEADLLLVNHVFRCYLHTLAECKGLSLLDVFSAVSQLIANIACDFACSNSKDFHSAGVMITALMVRTHGSALDNVGRYYKEENQDDAPETPDETTRH